MDDTLFGSFIEYDGYDEGDSYLQFYRVTFTKDFGPFRKRQYIHCLGFDLVSGLLTAFHAHEENLNIFCKTKLVPVE